MNIKAFFTILVALFLFWANVSANNRQQRGNTNEDIVTPTSTTPIILTDPNQRDDLPTDNTNLGLGNELNLACKPGSCYKCDNDGKWTCRYCKVS